MLRSTQSKGAATIIEVRLPNASSSISIHAAQEGCDLQIYPGLHRRRIYFNPRSPRGLRFTSYDKEIENTIFQSTQPKRAATTLCRTDCTEGMNFNPRSPRGLRRRAMINLASEKQFQSTQPKRAATAQDSFVTSYDKISIHAAQEGCDTKPVLR